MDLSDTKTLGFVGSNTVDAFLPDARYSTIDQGIVVHSDAGRFPLECKDSIHPGAKVTVATVPEELIADSRSLRPGGGAYNSWRAFKQIAPEVATRFLGSTAADIRLTGWFAAPATEVRMLALRPLPYHLILGQHGDKLILKSPFRAAGKLNAGQVRLVSWFCGSDAVLASSIKDEPVMSSIVSERSGRSFRLHSTLSTALAPDFVREVVLPAADAIYASWDETAQITGIDGGNESLRVAFAGLSWFRERAPRADCFVTLGKEGVVVLPAASSFAYHVRLRENLLTSVQVLVMKDQARVCGCGDAFAAGAVAEAELGRSLLHALDLAMEPALRSAVAGCASALNWIGYRRALAAEDFTIVAHPLRRRSQRRRKVA
jgi:sugar/nucleoside kinase (ribokinase family)